MEQTKRCGRCGEDKPADEFSACSSSKDGLQNRCKACHRETEQQRRKKFCRTCGKSKKRVDFHRNANAADGRDTKCKACRNLEVRNRASRTTAHRRQARQERAQFKDELARARTAEQREAEIYEEACARLRANTEAALGL